MLYIRELSHLARLLGTSIRFLKEVTATIPSYCESLELVDPAHPDKLRRVLSIRGPFRRLQDRMLRAVLLPKLQPSYYNHGGVAGRSIATHIGAHEHSRFALVADISGFFPSVSHMRVYRLFSTYLGCAPDVARTCTRLCTQAYHLALGLPTSPILADQMLRIVDNRIGAACEKQGLTYTRFVDDLAVSGPYDLARSGIPALLAKILVRHGFKVNSRKQRSGDLKGGFSITNLRFHNGHLDVQREYVNELMRQIEDVANLARGGHFDGPYFTRAQIIGRASFVSWVNPGRNRQIVAKLRTVAWEKIQAEALRRGLIATRRVLRTVSE
jgi:RNA-directed DNA polymerase